MTYITQHIHRILILATLVIFAGCAKTSIDEIPAYIAIDTISINVTSIQGTASQKISDAWIYADNELIGAYELPVQIPVLKSGASNLSIFAGIKLNGINELRVPYPFYTQINKSVELEREKITDLGHMKFAYASTTKFAWQEQFEYANYSLDSTARSEVNLIRTALPELDAVFPGENNKYVAKVVIPSDSLVFECASHDSYKLPTDGTSVFLELNYKSNNAFTVGLFLNGSVTAQRSVLIVNPSISWNKIYINLTPALAANNDVTNFKVFFTAMKSSTVPKAEIFFDNIKLLHF